MNPFKRGIVGNINVKNRIFRSATYENLGSQGGFVSDEIIKMYEDLSKGEVGLIITGFICFSSLDNHGAKTIRIDDDNKIDGLKKLTAKAHEYGTKVVAQLSHIGSQLSHAPFQRVLAPSDVVDPMNGIKPEPFSKDEIKILIKEFGEAALRAKKAGFDGVQIHGAHGYLLSKFLSPVFNKRNDEYGGSIENNVRIIVEVLNKIKEKCGKGYPVWIKLNSSDFGTEENSFSFDDLKIAAKELEKNGIDAIELSGGTIGGKQSPCRSKKFIAYHEEYASKLVKEIDVHVITVGGFRNLEKIENALENSGAVAVSICRSLIREPGLIKRWVEGDSADAKCVACNGCFNPNGTKCFFTLKGEEREQQKEIMKLFARS